VKPRVLTRDIAWMIGPLCACFLSVSALWLTAASATLGQNGVPLDDAWIHFQFARNLALGNGFSFNPGYPVPGSTAPLWTLILAGAYKVFGDGFPLLGQILSSVTFFTTVLFTFLLGRDIIGKAWAASLAAALVALNGRMAWAALSALEVGLFCTVTLLAVRTYLSGRALGQYSLWAACLFGFSGLCRPDGYLLFALSVVDFSLSGLSGNGERDKAQWLRKLPVWPAVLFLAIVSPYLVFSLVTTGHLLPSTYQAKATVDFALDFNFLSVAAKYLILDNPLFLPFFAVGIVFLIPQAPLIAMWCVTLPLAYALMHAIPYQHGRYLMPLIPFNALVGVWGLLKTMRMATLRGWVPRTPTRRTLAVLGVVLSVGTAWRLPLMSQEYAANVVDINTMHVAFGKWLLTNTSPDDIIAVNDIGAIGYISERFVVDLAGLISPEVIPTLRGPDPTSGLTDFLKEQQVDCVIIFPSWFPGLVAQSQILRPIHTISLEHNTIAGGRTMTAYETRWMK